MADLDLSGVPGPWTTSFVPGLSGKLTLDPLLHAEAHAYVASGVTMADKLVRALPASQKAQEAVDAASKGA